MQSKRTAERSFQERIEGTEKGRVYLVLPFDPEKTWGPKAHYHVRGTINGKGVRGALEQFGKGYFLPLGPAYRRASGLHVGDLVTVMLMPEGPQSQGLAVDIVAALVIMERPTADSQERGLCCEEVNPAAQSRIRKELVAYV